jgi:hypothetical protein
LRTSLYRDDVRLDKISVSELGGTTERRRHQRHELEVDITIRTDRAIIPGRSLEISESGMSAILPVELEDERVELSIKFPGESATTVAAVVRHRNVFRHGFQFDKPLSNMVGHR